MRNDQIKRITLCGVLAAVIIILTALVSVPLPGGHGYINLGDAGVLIAAYILGNPWGAVCGGVASALADVLLGWGIYAPATFIIKGGMALMAAWLMQRKAKAPRLLSVYLAALLVPVGYYCFEWALYGNAAALPNLLPNLIQCLVGAGLAHGIIALLDKKEFLVGVLNTTGDSARANPDETMTPPQPKFDVSAPIKIVREPKGGPDVVFLGCQDDVEKLIKAGDYLSVRGFTARIVQLPDGLRLEEMTPEQRSEAIPDGIPFVSCTECGTLQEASSVDLANAAQEAMKGK